MDEKRTYFIKKLLYLSQHRGMKEADVLVGRFAEAYLADMSWQELESWEQLLQENDNDLVAWLMNQKPRPQGIHGGLLDRLYDYAHARGNAS